MKEKCKKCECEGEDLFMTVTPTKTPLDISYRQCQICDAVQGREFNWLLTETYLNPDHCGYRQMEESYETYKTKEEALKSIKARADKPWDGGWGCKKRWLEEHQLHFKLCLIVDEYDQYGERIENEN